MSTKNKLELIRPYWFTADESGEHMRIEIKFQKIDEFEKLFASLFVHEIRTAYILATRQLAFTLVSCTNLAGAPSARYPSSCLLDSCSVGFDGATIPVETSEKYIGSPDLSET